MRTEPRRTERRLWGDLAVALAVLGLVFLIAITLIGRVDRAPGFLLTGALFVLPHLFLAHLSLIFSLWVVFPDHRMLPAIGGLVIGGGIWLWAPGFAWWGSPTPTDRIRVASWNVQRLWGLDEDRERALACVVGAIQAYEPDVLTLLEVSQNDIDDLSAALQIRCVHTPYHAGGSPKQGGLAVCARGSLELVGSAQRFVDDEDWHFVFTELRRGAATFNVLGVHLWPYRLGAGRSFTRRIAHGQANQSQALLERVSRFRDPTIVAGDFNSTRDFYLHRALRSHLDDAWERGGLGFGATKYVKSLLPLRIDFIYVSRSIEVHHTWVPADGCSDHRLVLTELSIPRGPPTNR